MIVFDLQCENGHSFEGWFKDSDAYEEQIKNSQVTCPVCNSASVSKMLSTFAIKSSSSSLQKSEVNWDEVGKRVAEFVENHFENVGCNFAKEALKIHYGVSEPRNIRGVSTDEEEKMLKDEGVEFFKVPSTPPSDPSDPEV